MRVIANALSEDGVDANVDPLAACRTSLAQSCG